MDLFPFTPRPEQERMLMDVRKAISAGKCVIAHAPTGIGKTAAVLAPALEYALQENKSVFFLTPRHSQHRIAIDTLSLIRKKMNIEFGAVDIIGKKWMCPVPGIKDLKPAEFTDFCDSVRRTETCEFYNKTIKEGVLRSGAEKIVKQLKQKGPMHCEDCIPLCEGFCPYEILTACAKSSHVIICDYFHLFHPHVRKIFLARTEKDLENSILIVDEGHNLPSRIRELMTFKLSEYMVRAAIREANHFAPLLGKDIDGILAALKSLQPRDERLVSEKEFVSEVEKNTNSTYLDLTDTLINVGDDIRVAQKRSFCASIGAFMQAWLGEDEGYTRIIGSQKSPKGTFTLLRKRCLDPSISSKEVVNSCHSSIMMSGTLLPLKMYSDLLGFPEDTLHLQYSSPFPRNNRMDVIVPTVTTRFSTRGEDEFEKIARLISRVLVATPGNVAVFFPSYELRDKISSLAVSDKTVLMERSGMSKSEKSQLLHNLESMKESGAVMYGVIGGSFSEGVDYPEGMLHSVVVVGVPLEKPNIEVNTLVAYYQKKFAKGWEYAYIFPAVNKAIQAGGRCFRSANDRGIVVYMDQRYLWENYRKCFPANIQLISSPDPHALIMKFWGER